MKKCVVIYTLLFPFALHAQAFEEFFQQKKTDLKYLGQQIAAFAEYIKVIEKGYDIAKDGLGIIGEIKNGEFNLHSAFFGSMKQINPAIAKYSKVAAIVSYQDGIDRCLSKLRSATNLTASEKLYVESVCSHLRRESEKNMEMLLSLITKDELTLDDGQRLRLIDELFTNTKDKYAFAESFLADTRQLSASRVFAHNESGLLQSLYQ